MQIGSTGSMSSAARVNQQNQNTLAGAKIAMPGMNGMSFKDVAASQGVFNNLKMNASPKVTMPGK
jgi:hypothetical protein